MLTTEQMIQFDNMTEALSDVYKFEIDKYHIAKEKMMDFSTDADEREFCKQYVFLNTKDADIQLTPIEFVQTVCINLDNEELPEDKINEWLIITDAILSNLGITPMGFAKIH